MNAIIPQQIEFLKKMRSMLLVQHSTMVGILGKQDGDTNTATLMAQAFDAAKNDDSFFLPPEVFDNADFKRAMKSFLSPTGSLLDSSFRTMAIRPLKKVSHGSSRSGRRPRRRSRGRPW